MSKSKLRKDKTCLNCRHVVEHKFCPNCGQENSDTRKTFHHLFIHFFEDLTHYENAFWKTIRNLIFRPSALTREYLSGKRLSYLAPVRLYIFISFITFFLITILPGDNNKEHEKIKKDNGKENSHIRLNLSEIGKMPDTTDLQDVKKDKKKELDSIALRNKKADALLKSGLFSKKEKDTILKILEEGHTKDYGIGLGYHSMDSLDNDYKKKDIGDFGYWAMKKIYYVEHHNTQEQIIEKFKESFQHNFSKVLFIYMPLFAFFLWIFHNKKRWYYFDHGIFTLHYFSFLLLLFLITVLFSRIVHLFGYNGFTSFIIGIFEFVCYVWMFYYFFPAHHRFYGETRIVSFIKTMVLFFINSFFIILIMLLFTIYTFLNLH